MTDSNTSGNDGWAMPGAEVPPLPQGTPPPPAGGYSPAPNQGYAPPPAPGYAPPPVPHSAPAPQQPSLTYRSWQPGIVALRPLPFGDFITVPFKAMRFNRSVIIGGPLLLFTVSALLTAFAIWVAANDSKLSLFSSYESLQGISTSTVIAGIVALVSWVVSDILATSIVYPAVAQAMLGERITLSAAIKAILPRIGHLLLLAFVAALPMLIVLALSFWILIGASSSSDSGAGAGVLGIVVLFLFVLIPFALVVSVYSIVARGAIILERAGVIRAIKRAIRLVPGRFWWSVLIMLVVGLIVGAVQQAFGFVTQIAAFIPMGVTSGGDAALAIGLIVAYIFQLIATCVTQYSFFGSTHALIYLDMRMRKEGLAFDLAKAAEARHWASQSFVA
ncbi:hypothetical protein LGT39_12115 [Demequina sp. TTPB684]|uniref:hypothetical protein n=1 Tax=unclassified Demequina TaxID=2620311 RepID=UPI001CF118C4|nr:MULTISPECIES: hypothetical protein [unclassified Demequina]MCB2413588.1 hypothetical protein [Demequina sp. TTPB684]UPU88559.1 hypothetical protein LGT36_001140 [Demequina sp. TMPB413]